MNDAKLIEKLIRAAYDSGYYSGKRHAGQPHHLEAIEERIQLRDEVLQHLGGLRAALVVAVDSIMDLRDAASEDAQAAAWIFDYTESAIEQARAALAATEAGE